MRNVLSLRRAGAQGVYASCITPACTSGSKAQARAAVNCVNTTSSWRRTSNPCARSCTPSSLSYTYTHNASNHTTSHSFPLPNYGFFPGLLCQLCLLIQSVFLSLSVGEPADVYKRTQEDLLLCDLSPGGRDVRRLVPLHLRPDELHC